MGARPRSTFTRLLVAHAHTRDACGSAATAERHAKPDFLEAAPPRIQNQFRMSLHPPKHRRQNARLACARKKTERRKRHHTNTDALAKNQSCGWISYLAARTPRQQQHGGRRRWHVLIAAAAARAHGGRETIAPFSHPFRTLSTCSFLRLKRAFLLFLHFSLPYPPPLPPLSPLLFALFPDPPLLFSLFRRVVRMFTRTQN